MHTIAVPLRLTGFLGHPVSAPKYWPQDPDFIRYANARHEFAHKTPASLKFADDLSLVGDLWTSHPPPNHPVTLLLPEPLRRQVEKWPAEYAWEVLRAQQPQFQELLDGIIAREPAFTAFEQLQIHSDHQVVTYAWRDDEGRPLPSGQSYYVELIHVKDPLDTLYLQLRQFLRAGLDRRLRRCPVCRRYFVQRTAHAQTFCTPACGQKAYAAERPSQAEQMRAYRRRKATQRNRMDLQRIREAKKHLRELGEPLTLDDLLQATGLSMRRWLSLRRWEMEQYGKARDAALV